MDAYLLHSEEMLSKVPKWARTQSQVVGDLFADAVATSITGSPHWPPLSGNQSAAMTAEESVPVVGLLPGSKVNTSTIVDTWDICPPLLILCSNRLYNHL